MEQFRLTREEALTLSDWDIIHRREQFEVLQKKKYQEAVELILICAQDIVNAWPTLTMRTLGTMTNRIDTLRQALEATQK